MKKLSPVGMQSSEKILYQIFFFSEKKKFKSYLIEQKKVHRYMSKSFREKILTSDDINL